MCPHKRRNKQKSRAMQTSAEQPASSLTAGAVTVGLHARLGPAGPQTLLHPL